MLIKRKAEKRTKNEPGKKSTEFKEHIKVESKKLGKEYLDVMKDSFSGLIER